MKITIKQLRNEFAGTALKARQRAGQISQQSAYRLRDDAKTRVPVDTGETRENITAIKLGEYTWEVHSTRPSADPNVPNYLEFGTVHMPARPYMTPAAESERPKFNADVRKLVDGLGR